MEEHRLSKVHDLACQLYCELETLKDEYADYFDEVAIEKFEELWEKSDYLQSELYELMENVA